jgi:hypothetical protein
MFRLHRPHNAREHPVNENVDLREFEQIPYPYAEQARADTDPAWLAEVEATNS